MQTFTTTAPITAALDIPAGRIQFIAAERGDTTVEIRPADAGRKRDRTLAEETTIDYADGTLRIQAPTRNQYLGPSGAVEVTVQLPAGSRIEARTASAEFRGVGRLGDIDYDSKHGPIKIDEAASVQLTTLAGDVTVGRLTGAARINTSKGDIRIDEATRGTLTLRTDAGDVSVGAAAGVSAEFKGGTRYGRIHEALRNDGSIALTIDATTSYGNITARSR
ncbi:DUF4097 family beta strand repeat-containing protein [Actinocatenispora comari]|jgi:hypothetical protein|uniref:DUF4097 domain-containing protein n=1 Tax=Actinocatenispora comari TaxID=2807577 RepID=A0A8J4EIN5_9ACTN|nr:DUF4097 family beta strand repeat-containing protein [Actinocatenispora comari]GIL26257.1 hypothetical protein NUM_15110 [Actinocatenispora comari]